MGRRGSLCGHACTHTTPEGHRLGLLARTQLVLLAPFRVGHVDAGGSLRRPALAHPGRGPGPSALDCGFVLTQPLWLPSSGLGPAASRVIICSLGASETGWRPLEGHRATAGPYLIQGLPCRGYGGRGPCVCPSVCGVCPAHTPGGGRPGSVDAGGLSWARGREGAVPGGPSPAEEEPLTQQFVLSSLLRGSLCLEMVWGSLATQTFLSPC